MGLYIGQPRYRLVLREILGVSGRVPVLDAVVSTERKSRPQASIAFTATSRHLTRGLCMHWFRQCTATIHSACK